METLMEILMEMDPDIDYANEDKLIDDHILDSFGVITLVSEIEDSFDVRIEAAEMIPENFNSVQAMWQMITRLKEN